MKKALQCNTHMTAKSRWGGGDEEEVDMFVREQILMVLAWYFIFTAVVV